MTFFYTVPSLILATVIILLSCTLSLLPYLLARRVLLSRTDEHSKELAGSVLFRVGALHSLILALIFAQELLNFNEARHSMTREAILVGNVFYDLERYDKTETKSARADLVEYTNVVINREWETLAVSGRLEEQAWQEWQSAYTKILDFAPNNTRQDALKDIMLDQVREISELRIDRENAALVGANKLFLSAAVVGIVIMSIAYFPFAPTTVNLTLLLLFGIYTGFVIYFILAFSNPFSGAGYIEPISFERLYEGMLKSL
jgi:hypothetical protein